MTAIYPIPPRTSDNPAQPNIVPTSRLTNLPEYVFAWLDELKASAGKRGADLIDLRLAGLERLDTFEACVEQGFVFACQIPGEPIDVSRKVIELVQQALDQHRDEWTKKLGSIPLRNVINWMLGAPGVGFLYVARQHVERFAPPQVSYAGLDNLFPPDPLVSPSFT